MMMAAMMLLRDDDDDDRSDDDDDDSSNFTHLTHFYYQLSGVPSANLNPQLLTKIIKDAERQYKERLHLVRSSSCSDSQDRETSSAELSSLSSNSTTHSSRNDFPSLSNFSLPHLNPRLMVQIPVPNDGYAKSNSHQVRTEQ